MKSSQMNFLELLCNDNALSLLAGKKYVFREKRHIRLVTLVGVKFDKTYLSLTLSCLNAPGFEMSEKNFFQIGCDTEFLTCTPYYIYASYVSWFLVAEDTAVQQLSDLMAQKLDLQTTIKKINDICRGKW